MAATFTELYDDASAETRAFGGSTIPSRARRRFIVPATTEGAALGHPSLPVANSVHPRLPSLIQLTNNASPYSGDAYLVEALYGENQFDAPPPPVDDESADYRDLNIETSGKSVDIPVIVARTVHAPLPDGSSIESREWSGSVSKLFVASQNLRIEVNLPVGNFTASANAAIRSEYNKVHQFDGEKWLFKGARVARQNQDIYRVEYNWEWETGNDAVPAGSSSGDIITGPDGTQRAAVPARLPYQEYEVMWGQLAGPALGGDLTYPIVIAVDRYDENLSGATGLPGNPLGAVP